VTTNQENLSRYYKVLELPIDATWAEIRKSYNNLKDLYSTDSIAILAVNEEMQEDRNNEIIKQIDDAYENLKKYFKEIRLDNQKKIDEIVSTVGLFDGKTLKKIRETLNIDLVDIAISSNIQINHLRNIENELYGALPNDVYLRGYLVNYAKFLSLDSKRVVDDYMQGYQQWRKTTSNSDMVDESLDE